MKLRIGPFDLQKPLGSGGMGMVWYAVHHRQNYPVAVKVMTARKAQEEHSQRAFRSEVRAVARLNHSGIIRVFDSGAVPAAAQDLTEGQILGGSPFLAMELATESLNNLTPKEIAWSQLRLILVHILHALAHAHARGLIHRDLKPANILFVQDSTDSQVRLKLADFGLAQALSGPPETDEAEPVLAGTPRYMAPEQINGTLRHQGPWTDLYALGSLAWWLATGATPFGGESTEEILYAHLSEPLPAFQPAIEVPSGFEGWVRRLLKKQPEQRFRRAADAAFALSKLDSEPTEQVLTLSTFSEFGSPTEQTVFLDEGPTRLVALPDVSAISSPLEAPPIGSDPAPLPPVPRTWRYVETPPPSPQLLGVGLGLFELRELRLVGRESERDIMWQALTDARQTGRIHTVVLTGPRGIGKTRLATWLAERAHEVGAAEVLYASHSPISGAGDGVSRMFADYLRCTGLSREALVNRVREHYAEDGPVDAEALFQCMALAELVAPGADPDYDESSARVQFSGPQERFFQLRQFLARQCRRRPLMLLFDDVHWGHESLQFLRFLLEEPFDAPLPIVVVITVRDDLLGDYPLAGENLHTLQRAPLAKTLTVEPLSDVHHRELIHDMLGLERELAAEVAERTAGNPLFAIQLVGDWVSRGILEISTGGFQLGAEAKATLPESIHQLLCQRLEKILTTWADDLGANDRVDEVRRALEIAAVLGREVDLREWRRACDLARVSIPENLVDSLVSQSLVRQQDKSWLFIHGALRETLERLAEEAYRLQSHHRVCATMLESLYGDSGSAAPRQARHLLAAGEDEALLPVLVNAIDYYQLTGQLEEAQAFVEAHDLARLRLQVGEDDERWVHVRLAEVLVLFATGQGSRAATILDQAEELCRRKNWTLLLARTLSRRILLNNQRGEAAKALECARQALPLFRQENAQDEAAEALRQIGYFLSVTGGSLQEALQASEEVERHFRQRDDEKRYMMALGQLGSLHGRLRNYAQAKEYLHQAMELAEKIGAHSLMANYLNYLGEVYRYCGDLKDAQLSYQRALDTYRRIGGEVDVTIFMNLGLTLMEQDKFCEAGPFIEEALRRCIAHGQKGFVAASHALMVPVAAARRQWDQLAEHLDEASVGLTTHQFVDEDFARAGFWGAEMACAAQQRALAKKAYELSHTQYSALRNTAQTALVEERLRALA